MQLRCRATTTLVCTERGIEQCVQQALSETACALIHGGFIAFEEQVRGADLRRRLDGLRRPEREISAPLTVMTLVRDEKRRPALPAALQKAERATAHARIANIYAGSFARILVLQ